RTTDAEGKVVETPLSPEQLEHVTQLVKDAVGFNAERGDSVNVVNAPFMEQPAPPPGELEKLPLWEQPLVHDIAKLVVGLIVLLVIILAVLRPLIRALLGHARVPVMQAQPQLVEATAGAPRQGAVAQEMAAPGRVQALAYEQQLAQARTLVSQDPKRVAQVVRGWVANDE